MNRSPLHGGPARGHQDSWSTQDARSSQDTRSNFAVQPAANTGTFKLKKKAVRIVSAAGPAPSGPPRVPQMAVKPTSPPSAEVLPPSRIELPSSDHKGSLEDMFARLSSATSSVPCRPTKEFSPAGPGQGMFSFDDSAKSTTTATQATIAVSAGVQTQSNAAHILPDTEHPQGGPTTIRSLPEVQTQRSPSGASWKGEIRDKHEAEYLHKASAYLCSLPTRPGDMAYVVKAVATKLQSAYATDSNDRTPEEVDKLQARVIAAVTSAINEKIKHSPELLTTDFVRGLLRHCEGDFLRLCAALVKTGYISLSDCTHVTALCRTVLDVLPRADESFLAGTSSSISTGGDRIQQVGSTFRPGQIIEATTQEKRSPKEVGNGDPLDSMKVWPSQEKREHGAIYRACVLKGVGGVKSLNQLQALVWGGRLESIQMPEPGSEHALVKFLTPEACQTYLDATENGIQMRGAEKKTIFVDRQPGPNSINDVIQSCIESDASRCVRATGADADWSDGALFKLARGRQSIPRDVDRVKQGKTARGHHYIEFRFGNIYHALNFKRHLLNDDEWEHCSISYAKDPCELASGVHHEDADEEGGGVST